MILEPRKGRSRKGGAQLAEFGPVLFVFLLIILFPLINLVGFACGSATAWLMARECASKAANSVDFNQAVAAVKSEMKTLRNSGFGLFARIVPTVPGACGANIQIQAIDTTSSLVTKFPVNSPAPGPIDTSKYIYEYVAQVKVDVGPFINMSGMPFIGSIPGLGQPAHVFYSTAQNAEFPDGLIVSASSGGGGGVTPPGLMPVFPGGGGAPGAGPNLPDN
jgi:hypothetical protein